MSRCSRGDLDNVVGAGDFEGVDDVVGSLINILAAAQAVRISASVNIGTGSRDPHPQLGRFQPQTSSLPSRRSISGLTSSSGMFSSSLLIGLSELAAYPISRVDKRQPAPVLDCQHTGRRTQRTRPGTVRTAARGNTSHKRLFRGYS